MMVRIKIWEKYTIMLIIKKIIILNKFKYYKLKGKNNIIMIRMTCFDNKILIIMINLKIIIVVIILI